jgi:hypothetical protein
VSREGGSGFNRSCYLPRVDVSQCEYLEARGRKAADPKEFFSPNHFYIHDPKTGSVLVDGIKVE